MAKFRTPPYNFAQLVWTVEDQNSEKRAQREVRPMHNGPHKIRKQDKGDQSHEGHRLKMLARTWRGRNTSKTLKQYWGSLSPEERIAETKRRLKKA